jgi:nucleotide-binding universal stress UspA family protein
LPGEACAGDDAGIMSAPIVVGYDPHGAEDAPIQFGLAASRFTGAPLVIAAVYGGGAAISSPPDGELREELSAEARAALDRLRERLRDEAPAQCEVRLVEAASAARGLAVALEDEQAGLGVVGATDRGAVGRTVVGSTAERVIHGAPCPVAVVPHGFAGGELNTIGVAFTPSDEGKQALRSGVALAHGSGATLRIITVLPERQGTIVLPHASDVGRAGLEDERGAAQQRVVIEQAVAAEVANAGGGDLPAEIELVYGDPAEALLEFTDTLDLLVMGSRAYGPQRAVLLGGVSRHVTSRARCPVIVLPRGAEHPLRDLLASRQAT